MKRIEASWESYRRQVLPPDAPEVQIVECRRAFYAGMKGAIFEIGNGIDRRPRTQLAVSFIGDQIVALDEELSEFNRAVQEGRA